MTAFVRRFSLLLIGALFTTAAGAVTPYLVDGDGDEVSDEIDDCPYTHIGVKVDAKGCPLSRDDADLDGVPDDDDDCPYSATGAAIDVHGCAIDGDFDGVADGIDRCPASSLAMPVDVRGCAAREHAAQVPAPTAPLPVRAAPDIVQPVREKSAAERPVAIAPPTFVEPALPSVSHKPKPPVPVPKPPAAKISAPANVPIIAAIPKVATVVAPAVADAPETPELALHFLHNSGRLGTGDLAVIDTYVLIFARRLIADPASTLRIRAFADPAETHIDGLAEARLSIVRTALIQRGIRPERIKGETGQMEGGDAASNRRVEVRLLSN